MKKQIVQALTEWPIFIPFHLAACGLLRLFLPSFLRFYLRKWRTPFKVFLRGSLLEPERFRLTVSDWDLGIEVQNRDIRDLAFVQNRLATLKKIWPFFSEIEIYTALEKERLNEILKTRLSNQNMIGDMDQVLKWARKVRYLADRYHWKTDPLSRYKHERAARIAWKKLNEKIGVEPVSRNFFEAASLAKLSKCFEYVASQINPGSPCWEEEHAIDLIGQEKHHPLFNFSFILNEVTESKTFFPISLSPVTYVNTFLLFSGDACLQEDVKEIEIVKEESGRARSCAKLFAELEYLRLQAYCRSQKNPEAWSMEWLENLKDLAHA